MREDAAAMSRATRLREQAANTSLIGPLIAALVLIVLGLFPDHEPALHLTAVGLGLFANALVLLCLVFSHGRPRTASGPVGLHATGGSSA
jgi:hypothetical protein